MFDIRIDNEFMVLQQGTSEGTQEKYYKDGYWYKLDQNGREGLAEYLTSKLLCFSDLPKESYILYEQGFINGRPGCRSKNYLGPNEEFVTLYRLYYNEFGQNLAEVTSKMHNMEDRIDYVLRFVSESCSLDLTEYFQRIFTLDRIILNEDRHFNNLALIEEVDSFRPAPIFDNGCSLLTVNWSVNWHFSIQENVRRVTAKPFCGSHERMYQYFGKGFNLRKKEALEWLNQEPESKERDVLIYQVNNLVGEEQEVPNRVSRCDRSK